jgi:hypothetical protein
MSSSHKHNDDFGEWRKCYDNKLTAKCESPFRFQKCCQRTAGIQWHNIRKEALSLRFLSKCAN